jgi:zinc D-Ala-D-Ala carboxypeptidase
MKKVVFAIGSILFLTGCSMDSVLDKFTFIQSDENAVQEEEQKLNGEVSEKMNGNKEETADHGEMKENGQGNEPETASADPKLTLEASLFNEVVQVNGKNVIQNATNTMALVNKGFALPDGYAPTDLVRPKVAFSFGDQDIEKSYLREEAATALELMFSDAVKNGLHLFAVSGYRSYNRQKVVFDAEVNKVGYEKAVQAVAVPGNSEHQTGLSMDISSESAHFGLTEQFGETAEGKWLANHAHRFGFVQRYPKGKEGITGYQYESWHYRYVGVKVATEIFENQLTLEEYFNIVEKI